MSEDTLSKIETTQEEKVKKPQSKVRKIIGWVLTGIFLALFAVFGAGQIDGMIHKKENYGQTISFGYGSFVILTDSMEPDYMTDSAIITHRDSLESVYEKYQESLVNENITIDMTFMDIYTTQVIPVRTKGKLTEQTDPTGSVMTHRLREVLVDTNKAVGEGRYTFLVSGINTSEHQAQAGQYQAFTEKQYLGVVQANSRILGGFYRFISSPWGLLVFLLVPAFYLVITSVLDIFSAMKDKEDDEDDGGGGNTPSSLDELSDKDRERLKKEMLEEMLSKKGGNQ